MDKTNKQNLRRGGRKIKTNPSVHRYVFRLTQEENAKFLALYEASGMSNKAKFIVAVLFEKQIRSVRIDKGTVDFYMRLTHFHSQFRLVGVNYNQLVKLLYRHFSEKKAAAFLFKLEKQTIELAALCKQIVLLIQEFEKKHLSNSD